VNALKSRQAGCVCGNGLIGGILVRVLALGLGSRHRVPRYRSGLGLVRLLGGGVCCLGFVSDWESKVPGAAGVVGDMRAGGYASKPAGCRLPCPGAWESTMFDASVPSGQLRLK